jgi:hypothetical protein
VKKYMSKKAISISVPKFMKVRYAEITTLTNDFCSKKLTEEYAQLSRLATAAWCRKKFSPLQNGSASTWACSIIYAVGFINFLFDKTTSPYRSAGELAKAFSMSQSTAGNKSKQVRDILKMHPFNHRWSLPSRIANSPSVWMISFNGFIVDARTIPREIQEIAFEKGIIPYIPDDR